MESTDDETPPLVAAPRHLRRRAFHEEIPDTLLVPGVQPTNITRTDTSPRKRIAKAPDSRESDFRRKRLIALIVVIAVSLSIPALVFALLLAG